MVAFVTASFLPPAALHPQHAWWDRLVQSLARLGRALAAERCRRGIRSGTPDAACCAAAGNLTDVSNQLRSHPVRIRPRIQF
jgi:predicted exporter